jgi:hypothetical protein
MISRVQAVRNGVIVNTPRMSYPGPGWPQPQPQPMYGGYGPPSTPSKVPAYVGALLFGMCAVFSLVVSIISWDGTSRNVAVVLAVPGMAFSEDFTGNVDFAITTGMIVGCSVPLLAILLALRLSLARWLLVVVGGILVLYYLYAVIKLLADGGGEYVASLALSLVLWLVAEVVVLLPATGQAMRRFGAQW